MTMSEDEPPLLSKSAPFEGGFHPHNMFSGQPLPKGVLTVGLLAYNSGKPQLRRYRVPPSQARLLTGL